MPGVPLSASRKIVRVRVSAGSPEWDLHRFGQGEAGDAAASSTGTNPPVSQPDGARRTGNAGYFDRWFLAQWIATSSLKTVRFDHQAACKTEALIHLREL